MPRRQLEFVGSRDLVLAREVWAVHWAARDCVGRDGLHSFAPPAALRAARELLAPALAASGSTQAERGHVLLVSREGSERGRGVTNERELIVALRARLPPGTLKVFAVRSARWPRSPGGLSRAPRIASALAPPALVLPAALALPRPPSRAVEQQRRRGRCAAGASAPVS